jgi:hypothetical protein
VRVWDAKLFLDMMMSQTNEHLAVTLKISPVTDQVVVEGLQDVDGLSHTAIQVTCRQDD